jgi:hypothetical protein
MTANKPETLALETYARRDPSAHGRRRIGFLELPLIAGGLSS